MAENLIVYYSLEGNTDWTVREIADRVDADLLRLEPKKAYPDSGFKKYFWGGKSATMKEKPELVPYQVDLSQYKRIILATPVWAGTFAPALRTFLQENDLKGKRIALAACSSGGGAQGCFKKLMAELKIAQVDATLSLIDPKKKPAPENREHIDAFCAKLK